MKPAELELEKLQDIMFEMLALSREQINNSGKALLQIDEDLAEDIVRRELIINALEINIDRLSENILALYNPLASDLRFVMSALKMSVDLERISDHAFNVAQFIINQKAIAKKDIPDELAIGKIFETLDQMFGLTLDAFSDEDVKPAKKTLKMDKTVNRLVEQSLDIIKERIVKDIKHMEVGFHMIRLLVKMERMGDQIKNISEEIIYFLEADIVRHKKKKKSIRKLLTQE